MRPHLGIASMSHMLVPLPLTENLDSLLLAHLALNRIPPLRSEMCISPPSAMWPFPLPKLPLSAEVSSPPDEQLSSKTGKKQSWSVNAWSLPWGMLVGDKWRDPVKRSYELWLRRPARQRKFSGLGAVGISMQKGKFLFSSCKWNPVVIKKIWWVKTFCQWVH